jgi:hypothetical protein
MGLTFTVQHVIYAMGLLSFCFVRARFGSGMNPRGCWSCSIYYFESAAASRAQARREAPDEVTVVTIRSIASLELLPQPSGRKKNMRPSVAGLRAEIERTAMDTGEKGIQWIGFEEPSLTVS